MVSSHLFSSLSRLTPLEKRVFRKFLSSPYFSRAKTQLRLFNILVNLSEYSSLMNEKLYKRLFPKKKYRASTMRNLLSDLHESLNEFFAYENFRNKVFDKNVYMLHEILKRDLDGISVINKYFKGKQNYKGDDYINFLNRHFLEGHRFNFAITTGRTQRPGDIEHELKILDNSAKFLWLFYYTQAKTYYNTYLKLQKTYDLNYLPENILRIEKALAQESIEYFKENIYEHSYITELYSLMIDLNKYPAEHEYYFRYKTAVNKYASRLTPDERSMHIVNLVSYCTGKVSKGFAEFNEEFLELIELIIEKKYYIDNKITHLPHEYYRNFLLHGLRMKKFEWAEKFINENHKKVNAHERLNMKNLGYAHLNFSLGNFSEALKYLQKINADFFAFKLDIKNLTVRIFYELGYTEEALSGIKAYMEYLRKDKLINPEMRKRYVSFLRILEKLVLYRAGAEEIDPGYIKHRILNTNTAAFKPWLMEKLNGLTSKMRRSA